MPDKQGTDGPANLGVGLISVGWMGRLHTRAYQAIPVVYPELGLRPQLIHAADTAPDRAKYARDVLGYTGRPWTTMTCWPIRRSKSSPSARPTTSTGRWPFRDCGVHDFDAVRWVTGREVVEVYATGSNRSEKWIADLGDIDTAATILTLDDGCLAVVSNTRYNARGYDVRLELHGSLDGIAAGLDDGSAEPGCDLSRRATTPVLHGPVRRGLPRRARRVH